MTPAPARQVWLWLLFVCAAGGLSGQTSSIFTEQPGPTVGVAGSYADFSFTVRVPTAFARLDIIVFRGSVNISPRFSIVRQSFSNGFNAQGSYTVGEFTVRIGDLTNADVASYTFEITVNGQRFTDTTSQPVALTLGPPVAPTITRQPLSALVSASSPVTFSVAATGTPSPSFQWYRDGVAINGANGPTYAVFVASNATGTYTVVASNPSGSVTSAPATLAIGTPAAPTFTEQPTNIATAAGYPLTLYAEASGAPEPVYQWHFNGNAIAGATGATYTIPLVSSAHSGTYTVTATNAAGSITSSPASVTLVPPAAPTLVAPPTAASMISGQTATFTVSASAAPPPAYQWLKDGAPIAGATRSKLTLAAVTAADAGTYSAQISNPLGSLTSPGATLSVLPDARLANLSVRAALASGARLIVGGVVTGGARDVLVRGIGPSLVPFGVTTPLSNPRLDLYDSNQVITHSNDDWPLALESTFTSVAAFPLTSGSKDSAFVQNLSGAFSIHTHGPGQGIVLAEMYDTGAPTTARLVNLSARTHVGTGDNILVAGFAIAGTSSKQLLIRAVGPALVAHGVTGFLADPQVELRSAGGGILHTNDNWEPAIASAFARVAAFDLPAGSRDAALLVTLPPGTYTAQVSGVNNTTGEALIEVYEVQ